jgi:hypothetical protein
MLVVVNPKVAIKKIVIRPYFGIIQEEEEEEKDHRRRLGLLFISRTFIS